MPNTLIQFQLFPNFMIEMSFQNESPLDHKGEQFPQNSLTVKSILKVRLVEKAHDAKESVWYESWIKEFGPLLTPGLNYWNDYEPLAITTTSLIIAGIGGELVALKKTTGDIAWRKALGEGWIRTVLTSSDHNALYILLDTVTDSSQKESLFKIDYSGNILWKTFGPDPADRISSLTSVEKNRITAFNLGYGFHLDPNTGNETSRWINK